MTDNPLLSTVPKPNRLERTVVILIFLGAAALPFLPDSWFARDFEANPAFWVAIVTMIGIHFRSRQYRRKIDDLQGLVERAIVAAEELKAKVKYESF